MTSLVKKMKVTSVIKGNDLKQRRMAKGLTQAALGELLGISGAAVSQWETEATDPSWQMAQKLEEIFEGLDPDTRAELELKVDKLDVEVVALRTQIDNMSQTLDSLVQTQQTNLELIKRLEDLLPPDDQ